MAITPKMAHYITACLENRKLNKKELAALVGVNPATIANWYNNNDEFLAELKRQQQLCFKKSASKALQRLEELVNSKNECVAVSACKEVLDRAGLAALQRLEANVNGQIVVDISDD